YPNVAYDHGVCSREALIAPLPLKTASTDMVAVGVATNEAICNGTTRDDGETCKESRDHSGDGDVSTEFGSELSPSASSMSSNVPQYLFHTGSVRDHDGDGVSDDGETCKESRDHSGDGDVSTGAAGGVQVRMSV
nr:hypothetical protein [Tanacetum cinerariifolium]